MLDAPRPDRTARLIGSPVEGGPDWPGRQPGADDCAIRCIQFVLQRFLGEPVSYPELLSEAEQSGGYVPGLGTASSRLEELLEQRGVPAHQEEHATALDLAAELARGHQVIVGVAARDLWNKNSLLQELFDLFRTPGADHVVVVTGIDTTDPGDVQVIVNDPGTGDAGIRYPLEQFLDAWEDSRFWLVATDEPCPGDLPEMQNFDYERGLVAGFVDRFPQFFAAGDLMTVYPEVEGSLIASTAGASDPDPLEWQAGGSFEDAGTNSDSFAGREDVTVDPLSEIFGEIGVAPVVGEAGGPALEPVEGSAEDLWGLPEVDG